MIGEVFGIYSRNWYPILIWSFLIIAPITIISFLGVLYIYDNELIYNHSLVSGWFLLVNFNLCIPPFLLLVRNDILDEQIKVIDGLLFFCKQVGLILTVSIVSYALGLIGMVLFFLPTVVTVIFLLVFPFFLEISNLKMMFKQIFLKMRDENLSLIGDVLTIVGLNLVVWTSFMIFIQNYDNNLVAFLILRVILNILILPLLYIYLILRYRGEDFIPSQ